MKKVLALLLVLMLTMCVLGACSDKKDNDSNPNETTSDDPVVVTVPTQEEPENNDEQVLVLDNNNCKITIDGIEYDPLWGYTINTTVINKTNDKNIVASLESLLVNGVQLNSIYYVEVAPEKTAKEDISIITSDEEEVVLGDKPAFTLEFIVKDTEDYLAEPLGENTIDYFPFGGTEIVSYVRESQPTDKVLVDNDTLSVVMTGTKNDEIMGYAVQLYLVNKTDKELMVSAEDVSVNGIMSDPFFAKALVGGASSFAEMSWISSDLEEINVTEVKDIELTLRVYDYNDIFAGDIVKEKITINP